MLFRSEEFHSLALPHYKTVIKNDSIDLMKISELMHTRTELLNEIPEHVDFFNELPEYSIEMYVHKKMKTNYENSLTSLEKSLPILEDLKEWNIDSIQASIMNLIKDLGVKNGIVLWPLRTALSGKQFTPGGAFEIADIIGKEESLTRIKIGIEKLKA